MTQDSNRTHKNAADESRMTIDLLLSIVEVIDVEEGKKVEEGEVMDEDAEFTSFEAVCVKLLSDDDGIPSASITVYLEKKNVTIIYEYHENVKRSITYTKVSTIASGFPTPADTNSLCFVFARPI